LLSLLFIPFLAVFQTSQYEAIERGIHSRGIVGIKGIIRYDNSIEQEWVYYWHDGTLLDILYQSVGVWIRIESVERFVYLRRGIGQRFCERDQAPNLTSRLNKYAAGKISLDEDVFVRCREV
jgi:hypothetical protein